MTNIRTAAELKLALDAIVAELKALDAATIPDADLVPLVKSIQNVSAYASAIDAQIRERAIGNNIMLPGVATKDSIKHRQRMTKRLRQNSPRNNSATTRLPASSRARLVSKSLAPPTPTRQRRTDVRWLLELLYRYYGMEDEQ